MTEAADGCSAQLTLRERLIALIRQILGPPAAARPLPIDARLADLGMSSLKMVNLMLTLEVQFDLAIPQSEITPENFASIASVEALIVRLQHPRSGGAGEAGDA
ncbi:MAG TPA: phosphopantetheine-binding protein [Steroidobacteraceae bacterium]|nr:phosphopantetheine-binding protein [Steroidobacteraceae bacterium]